MGLLRYVAPFRQAPFLSLAIMRPQTRGRTNPGDEMNFEYLDEFVHLAHSLSFRRTAEHFFVSRSVISRHMAALEESLGALLLVRNTHGVELTDAGEVFLQEAQSLLRGWNLARERVRAVSNTGGELVRIGYLRNGARPFLVRFVNSMAKEHPNIRLSLLCMKYGELRQALEEHNVDVAIGINVDSSISSNYRSTPIYHDQFVIVCNRENPLASMTDGITLDDLRDQRLLIPDSYLSSGLAEQVRPFVDDEIVAEAEELYMDMDLLYLKLRTEDCVAFISNMNATMFEGPLTILPIRDMNFGFVISAFYHDEFTGDVYEACHRAFEDCRHALADEASVPLRWVHD